MARIIVKNLTISILILLTLLVGNSFSFWGQEEPLVEINGTDYLVQDYMDWWQEWREGPELPDSPQDYIDWLLLAEEAKQMQLEDQPIYKKKVEVFLKVRSLMLLKKEEVSDKMDWPNEERLRQIYTEDYTPIWQLRTVTFHDRLQLDAFMELKKNALDLSTEQLLEDLPENMGTATLSSAVMERQSKLPVDISTLVQDNKDQRFTKPYLWNNTWQIIEILGFNEGSDQDFATQRDAIHHHYLQKQRSLLTTALIKDLMKKHHVEIDKEVLAQITFEGVAEQFEEQTVINILSFNITAAELYRVALQQYQSFSGYENKGVAFKRVINRVINDIISQNLTNAEALERHYELVPPFKSTFDFYRKHRLIKELERLLIAPNISITEQELKMAYESQRDSFAGPELIEIIRVDSKNEALAQQLNELLRQGKPFEQTLLPLSPDGFEKERLPIAHLSDAIQRAIAPLSAGTSTLVDEDGQFTFVKITKAKHQQYAEYEEVKSMIAEQLKREKYLQLRLDLIQKLRNRSTIEVDQQQWQHCLDTLKGQE